MIAFTSNAKWPFGTFFCRRFVKSTDSGPFFARVYFLRTLFLHKQSLCYSMNSLLSNLSRKYCCDAIVATKCVHFENVHFDPVQPMLRIVTQTIILQIAL